VNWQLPPHAAEVMALFGFPHGADNAGSLQWHTRDDGAILFSADCSDTFAWGTADSEQIDESDMPLLRRCFDDLRAVHGEWVLGELYAARKRGERPMHRWMKRETPDVQALFPVEAEVM
jgi:hypothetical protein